MYLMYFGPRWRGSHEGQHSNDTSGRSLSPTLSAGSFLIEVHNLIDHVDGLSAAIPASCQEHPRFRGQLIISHFSFPLYE